MAYPVNISVNAVAAYGIGHYFSEHYPRHYTKGVRLTLRPIGENLTSVTTPPGYHSHRQAAWGAIVDYYSDCSWWQNEDGVRSQYMCHFNYCIGSNPSCETWDFEFWCNEEAGFKNDCNPCGNALGGSTAISCNP